MLSIDKYLNLAQYNTVYILTRYRWIVWELKIPQSKHTKKVNGRNYHPSFANGVQR